MTRTWLKDENTGGWKCEMPDNVTLFAVPVHLARHSFTPKPSRGTQWRAGCTHWDEATRTATRFGRDAYNELQPDANTAKSLAGLLYRDEMAARSAVVNAEL
ncbi:MULTISPECIES: hypothetical protein [unclassified Shinella]|uniref:hypothetical protein n=1 Tax=unclassified Shinella TaxID=2643062 RepID=UPI00225DA0FD|nr:conserved hypothetical protein [Rhizobiaceae bacterium]CAK7259114.1 conserved protein of unknown function [Shinella sp. WSC3-e]